MTYRDFGYDSYEAYTQGPEFARLRDRCAREQGFSRYCYVCDDHRWVPHHENYARLGNEDLRCDVVALCTPHHTAVHFDCDGTRVPLEPDLLKTRRLALRKAYLTERLRSPDTVLPTVGRLVYRLLW